MYVKAIANIKTLATIASIGLLVAACDTADDRSVVDTTKPATTFKDSNPETPPALPELPELADTRPSTTAGDDSMRTSDAAYRETNDVSNIEGMELVGVNGEELGEVDRVVTERSSGKKMAVIGLEGIVGAGMKEVVVPLEQINLSPDGDKAVTKLSKRVLESLPDVDMTDFIEMTDTNY